MKLIDKIKNGKFIKVAKDIAPDILDIAGAVIPGAGGLQLLSDKIKGRQDISEEQKAALLQALNDDVIELEKLRVQDMDSARNREMTLRDSFGVYVQNISAILVVVAFIALTFLLLFLKVEVQNKELIYTTFGVLGTIVTQLYQYWFGSSRGSHEKNKEMLNGGKNF